MKGAFILHHSNFGRGIVSKTLQDNFELTLAGNRTMIAIKRGFWEFISCFSWSGVLSFHLSVTCIHILLISNTHVFTYAYRGACLSKRSVDIEKVSWYKNIILAFWRGIIWSSDELYAQIVFYCIILAFYVSVLANSKVVLSLPPFSYRTLTVNCSLIPWNLDSIFPASSVFLKISITYK